MSFTVGMCLLIFVSSLLKEDDLPQASAEKGTPDMQTRAATEEQPKIPRSFSMTATEGQGIDLHLNAPLVLSLLGAVVSEGDHVVLKLAEFVESVGTSEKGREALRSLYELYQDFWPSAATPGSAEDEGTSTQTGTVSPSESAQPTAAAAERPIARPGGDAETIRIYEDLLQQKRDALAHAESTANRPHSAQAGSPTRQKELAQMRSEIAELEKTLACLRAPAPEEEAAPVTLADGQPVVSEERPL